MEENIVGKIVENDNVYYLIKRSDSKICRKISRDELMKVNKILCEKYEAKHRNIDINSFINKKRKKSDSSDDNNLKDISSEETQRIHRTNKIKANKKIEYKQKIRPNPVQKKDFLINDKNKENKNKNIKENLFPKNNIKIYKEDINKFREGTLLTDFPKKIVNVGYKNRSEKKLYCLVEWEQKKDIEILDSIVESEKMKEQYPKLLVDFYESKLCFLYDDE